jgi:hypothetical protein
MTITRPSALCGIVCHDIGIDPWITAQLKGQKGKEQKGHSSFLLLFPMAFSGALYAVATGKLRLRVAPEMTGKMPVLLKQEIGRLESRAERGTAPRWKPCLPHR